MSIGIKLQFDNDLGNGVAMVRSGRPNRNITLDCQTNSCLVNMASSPFSRNFYKRVAGGMRATDVVMYTNGVSRFFLEERGASFRIVFDRGRWKKPRSYRGATVIKNIISVIKVGQDGLAFETRSEVPVERARLVRTSFRRSTTVSITRFRVRIVVCGEAPTYHAHGSRRWHRVTDGRRTWSD